MKEYRVTMFKKYPAWDEHNGILDFVHAENREQAIRFVRRQFRLDGHLDRLTGPVTWRAEVVKPEN